VGRDPGLCASAILSSEVYYLRDTAHDVRAMANFLVAGSLGLCFYAAAPLRTRDNFNLGTLCVIDRKPRELASGIYRRTRRVIAHFVHPSIAHRQKRRETDRRFALTRWWSEGDSNCRSHPTKSLVCRRLGTDCLQPQTSSFEGSTARSWIS
jgi:GAF domain-containing protein